MVASDCLISSEIIACQDSTLADELVPIFVRCERLLGLIEPSREWSIAAMFVYRWHHLRQLAIQFEIALTVPHLVFISRVCKSDSFSGSSFNRLTETGGDKQLNER